MEIKNESGIYPTFCTNCFFELSSSEREDFIYKSIPSKNEVRELKYHHFANPTE